jgi:aminopeptidase N
MRSLSTRRSRRSHAVAAALVAVPFSLVLVGAQGSAEAAPAGFTPGARSLNDSLYPTIGNGGYDARHYDLDLDYVVASKRLAGSATIDATATQGLSRFSFDLTAWNRVRRVTVDGRTARFAVDARRSKLTITPPRGIRRGHRFRTVVRYGGVQRPLPRTSLTDGWIPDAKRGAVVVAQPIGAMGWYPNNDVPSDKASYTTRITVPHGWKALATGVLTSRRDAGRGKNATSTFVWNEIAPTASYLVSISIGKFDVNSLNPAKPKRTKPTRGSRNRPVPFYTAITSSLPAKGKAASAASLGRSPEIVDFLSSYYGTRYPFTSSGGIVTFQTSFGLNLETQGKPTYAISRIDRGSGPYIDTVAHELAHQFFGNLVTPARWRDVWLSEGMAIYSTWVWSSTGTFFPIPPRDQYRDVYANEKYPISWRVPPADPGRPQDLFDGDAMYRRAPATIEAIREILGDDVTFKRMMRRWLTDHAYGSATTEQFVALVKQTDPTRASRWTEFFRQWLYTSYPTAAAGPGQPGVPKPQIHADNFNTYALPNG